MCVYNKSYICNVKAISNFVHIATKQPTKVQIQYTMLIKMSCKWQKVTWWTVPNSDSWRLAYIGKILWQRKKRQRGNKTFGLNSQVCHDIWTGWRGEKLLDLSWWHPLFKVGEEEDRKGRKKMREWRGEERWWRLRTLFNLLRINTICFI